MILIRSDANKYIGAGHIMRCISLAHELVRHGETVKFITADQCADKLIHDAGFMSVCLDSHWNCLEDETACLVKVIKEETPRIIIIDTYFVYEDYFHLLSSYAKTVYIDDINKDVWDVDILINYNIFADIYDYSGYMGTRTRLLLTPKYAMLRDEFRHCISHTVNGTVSNILVSAGGSDPENITEGIIRNICSSWDRIRFHFVVGALNPKAMFLKTLENDHVRIHINTSDMAGLMMHCDIAISAAGSTLYELCACGTPTITYTLADNQFAAADEFHKRNFMINAGDYRSNARFMESLNESLKILVGDREKRRELSCSMQSLVDGRGTERLAESLLTGI